MLYWVNHGCMDDNDSDNENDNDDDNGDGIFRSYTWFVTKDSHTIH